MGLGIKLIASMSVLLGSACNSQPTRAGEQADDVMRKIRAAVPDRAPARPAQPRKLLVFTLTREFHHDSIPVGIAALTVLGEKTGAFTTVQSEDPAVFDPGSLRQFDAVCLLNTTGELFTEPERRQAFLDFVNSGNGLIGIHAATDCCYEWPAYGEMIGGYFDGHPWNEGVVIKLDDLSNPINAAFAAAPLEIADEIYQFRAPYSRDRLHVLLSLDTTRSDMNKPDIHRTDGDFAVSWIRSQGQGRVFYCSLGHHDEIYWNPKVLRHYLAGIQYALGDLPVGAPPLKRVPIEWTPLFDGKHLSRWQYKPESWAVEDGLLARKGGGDIWTREHFGDFVLELEFKLDPQTNSGIFFRTGDLNDPVQTGIELQVFDSYGKPTPDKHDCGAIYDCLEPRKNAVRQPGDWNQVTLICKGSQIRAVMNGEPIIEMDLDRWTEAGKNPDGSPNKFKTAYKDMPRRGYIGFQDHGKPVWYRNIRIKNLTP